MGYQRLLPPVATAVLINTPVQMALPVRTRSSRVLAAGSYREGNQIHLSWCNPTW